MRITIEIRRPGWMGSVWLKRARPVVLLLALVFAAPVLAFDRFTDVGPGVHHDDISAIAAAGITQGCNPPANNNYCPADLVRRDQMGSFLARAAGLGANPPVANADKLDGLDSTDLLQGEVLRISHSVPATATNGGITWFTTQFTQPAGHVLSSVAAEATATVPATCEFAGAGSVFIVVDLDVPDSSMVGIGQWSAETAESATGIVLIDKGVHLVAPASATTRPMTVTIIDTCTGIPHWVFAGFTLDVVFAR
jgi:hypothetical protein